ncbi:neutral cholesterol ester hydrolase 1-like protein [Cricetulus griseus]|nr:neutral cholesterol ester hydrolase 1-like protein [Cricetulus griseus]
MYNWKTNHPSFSENPSGLTGLLESLMYSHQPTWDDCQQPLQVLFKTEERERILLEARKNVPGPDGTPTNLPNFIDAAFPLVRPDWDYNSAEGRGHLTVYRQALVAGLKGAAWRPTNLAKYVDDLLLAASTQELCFNGTRKLLKELGELGYRVSAKTAQLCRSEVTYLGYTLREGKRWLLTEAWKKTVMQIPIPTTPPQVRDQTNCDCYIVCGGPNNSVMEYFRAQSLAPVNMEHWRALAHYCIVTASKATIVYLGLRKLFSFRRSHLLFVDISVCVTYVMFRKWSPMLKHSTVLPTLSCKMFSVVDLC